MDLVLRNVLLVDGDAVVIADIGITDGRIAAVEPGLNADAEEMVCLVKTWSTRFIARLSCVDADHVAPGIVVVICGLRS